MSRSHYAIAYNLAGQIVPLAVGVVTAPLLLHVLGVERMGALAIAWLVVGFSGFLDLGLSRSLMQITAEMSGSHESTQIPALVWTAVIFAGGLAVLGTLALLAFLEPLLAVLKTSAALAPEARGAFPLFCLSLIPTVLSALLLGVLTAYGRFALMNAIRVPSGILLFTAPLLAYWWPENRLGAALAALTAARWATLAVIVWAVFDMERSLRCRPRFDQRLLVRLLTFGSWVTVSNIVSPVLVYCDRFLIGSLLSVTAVTYYATPQDAVTKLLALPTAIALVVFQRVSRDHRTAPASAHRHARQAVDTTFVGLFPLALAAMTLAPELMTLWLGADIAAHSWVFLQIFAFGIVINGLAQIPATFLQATGHPKWAALFHLAELAIYAPLLWVGIHWGSLPGAAVAWTVRIIIDAAALYWAVSRTTATGSLLTLWDVVTLGIPTAGLVLLVGHAGLGHRLTVGGAVLLGFLWLHRATLSALARSIGLRPPLA
jgi:O-antigen/teichoic acid export membrane protein